KNGVIPRGQLFVLDVQDAHIIKIKANAIRNILIRLASGLNLYADVLRPHIVYKE
ncbi:uncharacterized protein METZ01_LOCUS319842, partial [marine metagenome]